MAEKRINGREYRVEPMLATRALILQAKLVRVAGPLVSRLGDILQGHGTDSTEEQKARSNMAAVAAFSAIFAEIDPIDFAEIIKEIVETAQIKRPTGYGKVDMDGDLTGHSADIIPLCVFVLREQYGDFFTGLAEVGVPGLTKVR
jgi:Phage tail assembly chaperone protein, TAC